MQAIDIKYTRGFLAGDTVGLVNGCYTEPSPPQNRVEYHYERQREISAPGRSEQRIEQEERQIISGGSAAEREQMRQDFERQKRLMQNP
jgi:hypothetical protein